MKTKATIVGTLAAAMALVLQAGCASHAVKKVPSGTSMDGDTVASSILVDLSGMARFRAAGALNWEDLGARTKFYPGDLLYTASGTFIKLRFIDSGTTVQLQPETLFRIGTSAPTYTKQRRRFGVENPLLSQAAKDLNELLSNRNEKTDLKKDPNRNDEHLLSVNIIRQPKVLRIETPQPHTSVLASAFPISIPFRVTPEFMGLKTWVFVWREGEDSEPIWSGHGLGQIAAVPVAAPGKYRLQAMTDDESYISESLFLNVETLSGSFQAQFAGFKETPQVHPIIWVE